MKAADVMVRDVVTVDPETTARKAAEMLLAHRISAMPVVDGDGRLVGIVSEGDLIRRAEIGTERRRSWWLELLTSDEVRGADFVKSHAVRVADLMTRGVVTAREEASLGEIASLLERHGIKRVPIVRDGRVVGIVSRANILQAFAGAPPAPERAAAADDRALRDAVTDAIRAQPWGMPWLVTVTVRDGAVELWGPVGSEEQRRAIRVAVEATPGVAAVTDNLYLWTAHAAE